MKLDRRSLVLIGLGFALGAFVMYYLSPLGYVPDISIPPILTLRRDTSGTAAHPQESPAAPQSATVAAVDGSFTIRPGVSWTDGVIKLTASAEVAEDVKVTRYANEYTIQGFGYRTDYVPPGTVFRHPDGQWRLDSKGSFGWETVIRVP